jgi:hypothetical protein
MTAIDSGQAPLKLVVPFAVIRQHPNFLAGTDCRLGVDA